MGMGIMLGEGDEMATHQFFIPFEYWQIMI